MTLLIQLIMSLIVMAGAAYLWHLGGQGKKWARLFGVGALIAIGKALMTLNPWTLLYAAVLPICISAFSYGLKSPIHKFYVWLFKKGADGNDLDVEMATRATCGFLWSLAAIVFVVCGGHTTGQIFYSLMASALVMFFGVQKDVKTSEIGTGAAVALSVFI